MRNTLRNTLRNTRITIVLSILLLATLACNLATGIQAAQTEVPAMMTSAPTVLGPVGTVAAQFTPPAGLTDNATAVPGYLGISLKDVRTVMDPTQQFTFTNQQMGGRPAAVAGLSASAAKSMPGLAGNFSAAFIGDPANLSEIRVNVPYTNDKAAIQQGLTLMTVLFSGFLPPDVLLSFIPWITQNYETVQVETPQVLTVKNMKFTLSRTQTVVQLDISPLQ